MAGAKRCHATRNIQGIHRQFSRILIVALNIALTSVEYTGEAGKQGWAWPRHGRGLGVLGRFGESVWRWLVA